MCAFIWKSVSKKITHQSSFKANGKCEENQIINCTLNMITFVDCIIYFYSFCFLFFLGGNNKKNNQQIKKKHHY